MTESRPLRLHLVSQGQLGTSVGGHSTVAASLRRGLAAVPGVADTHEVLPPRTVLQRLVSMALPGLASWDLDLFDNRWLAVEGLRGRRALAAADADVLHVNSHVAALRSLGAMRRTPTLLAVDVTVWDWAAMGIWRRVRPWSRPLRAGLTRRERRAFEAAACVVPYSQWAADGVRRIAPGARVEVIHPGIDTTVFVPAPRRPRDRPRLLFVGARFAEKGGADLVAALQGRLGTEVDLDVVTREPPEPQPGVRLHSLSPGDPALVDLFQQADLFCMPTHGDSFGLVLLEALACGTPVLTSPVGAIGELLGSGTVGVAVPPGDVPALRRELLALLADPDRLARMGEEGRAVVTRDYDSTTNAGRLADLAHRVARG